MSSYLPQIVSFFKSKGLSDVAIAGIVGNMEEESGLNPNSYNAKEGAIGFCNWEGSRRTELQQWALNHHGAQETDAQSQLEFLWHELTTSYSSVLHELQNAKTVAQAATIFDVGPGGAGSGTGFENSSGEATSQRIQYATQWANGNGLPSSATQPGNYNPTAASANVGGTDGGSGPGGQMTRADYATVDGLGDLLKQIPALRQLVNEAVQKGWSATQFENQVENSDWWRNHSDTARAAIIERVNDPKTWQQHVTNATNSIQSLSHQLGMGLTADEIHAIAVHSLMTGNDSNTQWLTQAISNHEDYSNLKNLNNLQGQMAGSAEQLQQLAAQYGVKWSPSQYALHAQNIVDGTTTIDTYQRRMLDWAKSAFPGLAKQLDEGQTVAQLADPYVQSMSQILEMSPGRLDTYTPMIRQALQGSKDKSGDWTPTSLIDFERQLRQDPRFWKTQGATDLVSSALLKLGQDWGFGPEG